MREWERKRIYWRKRLQWNWYRRRLLHLYIKRETFEWWRRWKNSNWNEIKRKKRDVAKVFNGSPRNSTHLQIGLSHLQTQFALQQISFDAYMHTMHAYTENAARFAIRANPNRIRKKKAPTTTTTTQYIVEIIGFRRTSGQTNVCGKHFKLHASFSFHLVHYTVRALSHTCTAAALPSVYVTLNIICRIGCDACFVRLLLCLTNSSHIAAS